MEEWSTLCRCCLATGARTLLMEDHNLRSKFFETTTIEVTLEDGLPQGLCVDCLNLMNAAHQFKKQCLRIDSELKTQLANVGNLAGPEDQLSEQIQIEYQPQVLELQQEQDKKPEPHLSLNNNNAVKSEPMESDDDCYYVLVIDDPEKDTVNIKEELKELNPATGELEFEKSVDSFLVKNPHDKPTVDAADHDCDDQNEQFAFVEDHETNDSEDQSQLDFPTDFSIDNTGTLLTNGDGNIIKILTGNANSDNLFFKTDKDDEIVTYIVDDQFEEETDELSQGEVIVCEGDNSQFQLLNCEGELVIEYSDEGHITSTVMRQKDGKYFCSCGEQFSDLLDLESHQSTHIDLDNHLCSLCGKGFESSEILTGHMLLHTNSNCMIQCPFCEQKMKRSYVTQHIKYNHNNIKPQCSLCHKTFANPNNLKRHMTIHSGDKPFQCDVCSKRFQQKVSLQTHKIGTHSTDNFKCEVCQQRFSSSSDLIQHQELQECHQMREVRSSKGNIICYSCQICNKMFSVESALKFHMEMVHDDKSLELLCSECGEVLPNRKAMNSHMAQHKPDTVRMKDNTKRFECNVCGKNCTSQAMLIMHDRVHTNERPYHCPLCALRFKTKTHLRTHQLTHTREKRFGCSVCMKFFALKGNLVVHLRTHTGERPYVCAVCNEAFIDSKYLKKHKERKHLITNVPWNQY